MSLPLCIRHPRLASRTRTLGLTAIAGTLTLLACNASKAQEPTKHRPNIVLLFADDAGYADFSMHGRSKITTPAIDSIAKAGVLCRAAYVCAPVCAPSRAGLLTGRQPLRFGFEYNLPGAGKPEPHKPRGLPLSQKTIARRLRAAGYHCGLIGKWHQGRAASMHPMERGFHEFFGMLGGGSSYLPGSAKNILRGHEHVPAEDLPYLTDAFGDEAAAFIERNAERPFFLFVSFNAPHTPLQAKPDELKRLRPRYKGKQRATNAAMTRSLDENVAKLLAKLREKGLLDNTLVVFTNDNGGAMPYNASCNDPYSGTKGTFLEGGVRVPFCAQWPGEIPAGTVFDGTLSLLDLAPTFCAVAGAEFADAEFDGVDILPYLRGKKTGSVHETLHWRLDDIAALRQGKWKLVRFANAPPRLHDLLKDPREAQNLAEAEPEITARLLAELERWEAQLAPPLWPRNPIWRKHTRERYDQAKVESFKRH